MRSNQPLPVRSDFRPSNSFTSSPCPAKSLRVIGASFDDIAPLATLTRVRCPTLLVHGRADSTVPVGDAQRLVAVSSRARLLLVDGDHDLRDALGPHARTLVDFLRVTCPAPVTGTADGLG